MASETKERDSPRSRARRSSSAKDGEFIPDVFPINGNKSRPIIRSAARHAPRVSSQPMRESSRRPSDDLAEIQGMMALMKTDAVSALGRYAIPPIPPSTLNKAYNRLAHGRAKRPITATMEKLRRGLRALGHKDADWLGAGTINQAQLTIALRATTDALSGIRSAQVPNAAAIIKKIMDKLATTPTLSDEAAEAVAEALAEELGREIGSQ